MMSIRVCLLREEAGAFSRVKQPSTLRGHHNYQHLLLVDLGACHGLQVVGYGSLQSFLLPPSHRAARIFYERRLASALRFPSPPSVCRYHKLKFFDRRKALRRLGQVHRKLKGVSGRTNGRMKVWKCVNEHMSEGKPKRLKRARE